MAGISVSNYGDYMLKKLLFILAVSPAITLADQHEDMIMARVDAASKCLTYLTMFNKEQLKDRTGKVHELSETYQSAVKEALKGSYLKDTIDSLLIAKSGTNFNDDFYSGYILASITANTTKEIKDTIPEKEGVFIPFSQLEEQWSNEAYKRYVNENCEIIK